MAALDREFQRLCEAYDLATEREDEEARQASLAEMNACMNKIDLRDAQALA